MIFLFFANWVFCSRPLCERHSNTYVSLTCRPSPEAWCNTWKKVARNLVDIYTLKYYDAYCNTECFSRIDEAECLAEVDGKKLCAWNKHGNTIKCRGNSLLVGIMSEVAAEQGSDTVVTKAGQFSYAINMNDCYRVCVDSVLGLFESQCESLLYCCSWLASANRCDFDAIKVAKRNSPAMAEMATLDMNCRRKPDLECLDEHQDYIRLSEL